MSASPPHPGSPIPPHPDEQSPWLNDLLRQCEAMIWWAGNNGLTPPSSVMTDLRPAHAAVTGERSEAPAGSQPEPPAGSQPETDGGQAVLRAHQALTTVVAPARPDTIAHLHAEHRARLERRGWRRGYALLGPLPIVRQVVVLSLVFLIVFVALAASPRIRSLTADVPTTQVRP